MLCRVAHGTLYSPRQLLHTTSRTMGKKKGPEETCLIMPLHPSVAAKARIIDTHLHILSTYAEYARKYPAPGARFGSLEEFATGMISNQGVKSVVDVWCDAPLLPDTKEVISRFSAMDKAVLDYHFVIGAHPHDAKKYDDAYEAEAKALHALPTCVGWGEIGLDYHYTMSPPEVQKAVLVRQLRCALDSGLDKAITIHTREADDDIYAILTEHVPREQRIHVHCFTDSPELAGKLLDHFPNLVIGITGVVTYASNENTANVIRNMVKDLAQNASPDERQKALRIIFETDAPFMTPKNLPKGEALAPGFKNSQRVPFCHSGMIPWTADFVAEVLNENFSEDSPHRWTAEGILNLAAKNAQFVYKLA